MLDINPSPPDEPVPPGAQADGDLIVRQYFDRMTRTYLRQIISDNLIEEHRRKPTGHHSEALGRLLFYFRNLPISQQYALQMVPSGKYRIISLDPQRVGLKLENETVFDSLAAGYHGVFLQKLNDLLGMDNG
ncbi:hypothetical protein [Sinorhizobium meliloti]|uniref:hypothetical protein n=1 Tax=Rhizobium meliloti TaxID=382 RepID=UPI002090BE57|nr:hypothetical protein [Sinorhizobium meliloti]MCO5966356.1 hypothetical protein [Sinorhizobium meliloti]